jgi:hypothetical protein
MSDELFTGISDDDIIEKEKKELQSSYRFIFTSTEVGLKVLADILVDFCHFGCYLSNPDEVAQYNVGVQILSRMGVFSGGKEVVVRNLVNSLQIKEE